MELGLPVEAEGPRRADCGTGAAVDARCLEEDELLDHLADGDADLVEVVDARIKGFLAAAELDDQLAAATAGHIGVEDIDVHVVGPDQLADDRLFDEGRTEP